MLLSDSVTITDVEAAQKRLLGIAHQTPVITSNTVNELTQSQVFFKCENFQRTGAFKFRGAYNALVQLSAKQKIKGVITYSSGNHGQAIAKRCCFQQVALAGKLLNIPTIVVMPDDAPIVKQTATRAYGAEVILYNRDTTNRAKLTKTLAAERELTLIPPYDHPHIIAGQGTTALELVQEVGQLDYLLVCCGGGGLISGCAVATKAVLPNCKIIGVEPELADDATRSFYTKTLQIVHNPHTIADGVRTPSLGKITFPLVLRYVDDMVTVSDAGIIRIMFLIWERLKIVVEPTGVIAATALLEGVFKAPGARIGVIISGGNVDLLQVSQLKQLNHLLHY
ncbi:threo-3-hydroxy-L-aspartate ammonia-lyase [Dolichospermum sp. LEGE 00240]|uniref:threo-3-hydroxy-L-aspartate ammonia-lyase n=1 Tax=Dolichospermum sp. LEGE 00240 TaxID=1828603 RepID=UPI0018807334|nr:threo-3-hydroxy-L-aspartate ammonia-lyase [Dolichospermum sp. LEGE 00240]MBE9249117.1 threo-3-hydroxy-L-aspartate ammonia-lyase [Dolichospermum sp. LEGE 00240]